MTEKETLNQILDHVIEIKGKLGEVTSSVSSSHKRLDEHAKNLDEHAKDIDSLKSFKWRAIGIVTAASTAIGWGLEFLNKLFHQN